jgi:hypothetical protein
LTEETFLSNPQGRLAVNTAPKMKIDRYYALLCVDKQAEKSLIAYTASSNHLEAMESAF